MTIYGCRASVPQAAVRNNAASQKHTDPLVAARQEITLLAQQLKLTRVTPPRIRRYLP